MRSSHGGVAVSNTDDRRFDSFRACEHRATSPGTSSLTTAEASFPGLRHGGPGTGRSRRAAASTDPHRRPRAHTEPPWLSQLERRPVKPEVAGANPVGGALVA